jgi:ketol-acid reductoisomerase
MMTKVAIIAPGAMGSAVGRRLREHGARVLTSLTGRGAATIHRAEAAGVPSWANVGGEGFTARDRH